MAFATLGLPPEMYVSGLLLAYLDVKATKEFQRCIVMGLSDFLGRHRDCEMGFSRMCCS